jgi:hypothetical protein
MEFVVHGARLMTRAVECAGNFLILAARCDLIHWNLIRRCLEQLSRTKARDILDPQLGS